MISITDATIASWASSNWAALREAQQTAFVSLHRADVIVPTRLILPVKWGPTLFKPAAWQDYLAIKVVSVRPGNAVLGLPTVPATILLFQAETGVMLATLDGTVLTAVRTAAGSGP